MENKSELKKLLLISSLFSCMLNDSYYMNELYSDYPDYNENEEKEESSDKTKKYTK